MQYCKTCISFCDNLLWFSLNYDVVNWLFKVLIRYFVLNRNYCIKIRLCLLKTCFRAISKKCSWARALHVTILLHTWKSLIFKVGNRERHTHPCVCSRSQLPFVCRPYITWSWLPAHDVTFWTRVLSCTPLNHVFMTLKGPCLVPIPSERLHLEVLENISKIDSYSNDIEHAVWIM
jgi:hypothetical protein